MTWNAFWIYLAIFAGVFVFGFIIGYWRGEVETDKQWQRMGFAPRRRR